MGTLLVIGNKNYSSWSLRPWLLLRHFGIEFAERRLALDTEEFRTQIARFSPNSRVPVLHDGELVVWDSLAICEYVNERYLHGAGWPQALAARAQARAAAAEMHSGFAALRQQLPMNCRRQPDGYRWDAEAERDIRRVQQLWTQLRADWGGAGDFLCGDFGIVDAMFAPVVLRFRGYGVAVDASLQEYCATMLRLPAMQEWLAAAALESESLRKYDALA